MLPHTHKKIHSCMASMTNRGSSQTTSTSTLSFPIILLKYLCWEACSVASLLLSFCFFRSRTRLKFTTLLRVKRHMAQHQTPKAFGCRCANSAIQEVHLGGFLYIPSFKAMATSHFFGSLEAMCSAAMERKQALLSRQQF